LTRINRNGYAIKYTSAVAPFFSNQHFPEQRCYPAVPCVLQIKCVHAVALTFVRLIKKGSVVFITGAWLEVSLSVVSFSVIPTYTTDEALLLEDDLELATAFELLLPWSWLSLSSLLSL
jgi:hypothetical protein